MKNNIKRISLGLALIALFYGCGTDVPTGTVPKPILELQCDSLVTYAANMNPVVVTAGLMNENHGTMDTGTILFSARIGVIQASASIQSGVCNVNYFPKQSSAVYYDTITGSFAYNNGKDTVRGRTVIKVLPSNAPPSASVANVSLSTSLSELAVDGTGGPTSATITATVTDANGNSVKDGLAVRFRLISSPGGYINSAGKTEDTAKTQNGSASVTFNSGTTPGPVEILAQCSTVTTQQTLLSIQAGPTVHLSIQAMEDSVIRDASGSWKMFISATCTDMYFNPVKDGISVFFTFDTGYQYLKDSVLHQVGGQFDTTFSVYREGMKIYSSSTTGRDLSGDTNSGWRGTAATYITYPTGVIFDSIKVVAYTIVNQVKVMGSGRLLLALPVKELLTIVLHPPTSALAVTTYQNDTAYIVATLQDGSARLVEGATLEITSDKGVVLDLFGTKNGRGTTDSNGEVTFAIKFDMNQKPVTSGTVEFTNNVTVSLVGRAVSQAGSFIVSYP